MGKIYCANCSKKANIETRIIPNSIDVRTGRPQERTLVICHNCRSVWDVEIPNNPYYGVKKVAGNKFIDIIAILSLFVSCFMIMEIGIGGFCIPFFWLLFYGIWYEKAKHDRFVDESKLKQSLIAITVMFFMPIGFVIIF